MSLATTCSACGTVFRVVQDQLKISEGWVRCGRCSEVFNALESLFDLDNTAPGSLPAPLTDLPRPGAQFQRTPAASATGASGAAGAAGPARKTDAARTASAPARAPTPTPPAPTRSGSPAPAPASTRAPEPDQEVDPGEERHDPSLVERLGNELFPERRGARAADLNSRFTAIEHPAFDSVRDDADVAFEDGEPSRPLDTLPPFEDSEPQRGDAAIKPEFVRAAERQARWHRPGVRALLSLVALALLATLALQVAHHARNTVAARWPATLPLYAQWCDLAGCAIEPPRRIDDISVESTSFSRIGAGADQFRVSVGLRNRGMLALAMPWVELSLTDASGKLLVRKALSPQDFRVAVPVLAAQGEAQLQLLLAAGTSLVTGYTVEIFYP
jgi:predicted Zn finger-like uncharacterized protein